MSTTSHQHVRIADANLDLPSGGLDGVKIRPASSKRPVVVSFENFMTRPILTRRFCRRLPRRNPRIFCLLSIRLMDLVFVFSSSVHFPSSWSFSVRESLILTIKFRMLREGKAYVHLFPLSVLMPSSRGGVHNRISCPGSAKRLSFSPTSHRPGW